MAKKDEMVVYNGVKMHKSWEEEIIEAQQIKAIMINGKEYRRINYGNEEEDWGADDHACDDCAVIKGQFHVPGCDIERCPACGGQAIGCDCEYEGDEE